MSVVLSSEQLRRHAFNAETDMAMSFAFEQAWKQLQRRVPEGRRSEVRSFLVREIHRLAAAGVADTNRLRDGALSGANKFVRPYRRR